MTMKKMLVVGDSYADHHEFKYKKMETFPIWPELIAEKYDYMLLNKAQCGYGNRAILNNFLDNVISIQFDLAIIMWTKVTRVDVEVSKEVYSPKYTDKEIKNTNYYNQIKDIDSNNFMRQLFIAQTLSERLGVSTLQLAGTSTGVTTSIINSKYITEIDKTKIWGFPFSNKINGKVLDTFLKDDERLDYVTKDDDKHPNEKGHQKMAHMIENILIEKELLVDTIQ